MLELTGEEKPNILKIKRLRKLSRRDYDWKFPIFADIITRADTRMLCSMFKEFVNSLLLSPYKYLDDIEKYAQDMTKDELKFSMSKVDNLGQSAVEKIF